MQQPFTANDNRQILLTNLLSPTPSLTWTSRTRSNCKLLQIYCRRNRVKRRKTFLSHYWNPTFTAWTTWANPTTVYRKRSNNLPMGSAEPQHQVPWTMTCLRMPWRKFHDQCNKKTWNVAENWTFKWPPGYDYQRWAALLSEITLKWILFSSFSFPFLSITCQWA